MISSIRGLRRYGVQTSVSRAFLTDPDSRFGVSPKRSFLALNNS
jgi:hypothetical protein